MPGGHPYLLRVLSALLGLFLAGANIASAHATTMVNATPLCTGSVTLTFSPPLTRIPGPVAIGVSGSGSCTDPGLPMSTSISWQSTTTLAGQVTSCEDIVASGPGTVTVGSLMTNVFMVMAGPTPVQFSIYIDTSGLALLAVGVFTWTDTTALVNCLTGTSTISSMTLWGAMVVVTR